MWKIAALTLLLSPLAARAQSPPAYTGRVDWDPQSGIATFATSGNMPETREGFFWLVPPEVKKIVIGADVAVHGGFRVAYRDPRNPLFIEGVSRRTSIIHGTDTTQWTLKNQIADSEKWKYGSVSVLADATVYVTNLTAKNPRGYNISGNAGRSVIHVSQCNLLDARGGCQNNSDGFCGAAGSSIRDSFISTFDDGIKVYHDMTIERVTIEQHRNGAPIQLGWGGETGDATATISDLTIRGVDPHHRYNMAPITWERGTTGTRNLWIKGLNIKLDGWMYDDEHARWIPMGLFKLKPWGCTVNLHAERAIIDPPVLGIRHTNGSMSFPK